MPPAPRRVVAALAVLLLAVLASRLRAPQLTRRHQAHMEVLETSTDMTEDWLKVVSRDPERCVIEEYVRAGARGFNPKYPGSPPPHRHTHSVEVFEVLSGEMSYVLDGQLGGPARAGDTVSIPAGAPHFFFNSAVARGEPTDLHFRFSLSPCGTHPTFFENLAGISADSGGRGGMNFLQAVTLFSAHGLELAVMPRPLWRVVATVVPPIARVLGYKGEYPEYASAGGRGA